MKLNWLKKWDSKITKVIGIVSLLLFFLWGTFNSLIPCTLPKWLSFDENYWGNFVLFLTFIVVAWTTFETARLRRASFQNFYGLLRVNEIPTFSTTNSAGLASPKEGRKKINFRIFLTNVGTGGLKISHISEDGFVSEGYDNSPNPELKFYVRGTATWEDRVLAPKDTVELDFIISLYEQYNGRFSFRFSVFYWNGLGLSRHRFLIDGCHAISMSMGQFKIIDLGKLAEDYSGIL